ncbi:hypothetical protein N8482_03405, partial [Chitinophagales bacterium]|nr:hypothetical protein [Chitinophagales bacterium]
MTQQLEISDYQSADHAVLQDLVINIAEQVEYLHISTQEALATYALRETSPYSRRFLAELNGDVVGFAQLSWEKLRRSCHVGRIDVVVLQQFKGMDIEDELMIHCEFIAGELGLTRLEMKAIQTDFDSV